MSSKEITVLSSVGVGLLLLMFLTCGMVETVSTGHEAVGTRFGKVTGQVLKEGFNFPVNPLNSWDHFSTLEVTAIFEETRVPAKDQQTATMDVSIQWKIRKGASLALRSETGSQDRVFEVHFVPNVRAALRDAGRSTQKVEQFYDEAHIQAYREEALRILKEKLEDKGIEISDVLIRDVSLPTVIANAIESKKEREQEVEKERAELERVRLAAQQKVAQADADLEASKRDSEAKKIRAEAEAFAIKRVTNELNPTYVEYIKAQSWDGKLPQITGNAMPLINFKGNQ